MDALKKYWEDKYSPAELIEHIGINMDDLMYCLSDYFDEHINDFREDIEEIFGYKDTNN